MARTTQVDVQGQQMDVHVDEPAGPGPHPAVLVIFHAGGIDDFTKKVAERCAAAGYVAVAPNLFHRRWGRENLVDTELKADIGATVELLKGMSNVDSGRVAIMGHCMGGRVSLLGACLYPDAFKGVVDYYGGNCFVTWGGDGPTPFDQLKNLRAPVVGFFGNDDGNPSPADVDKIDAELGRLGIPHEFHRYDGAGHAFQNFLDPSRFREGPDQDAWAKTVAWLQANV